jgi:alkanesulfonate monooxygenase SsuD/methylene tetrahydromethanopterin reductase-like flavin-dependent oxidoreductase (luciferase family)
VRFAINLPNFGDLADPRLIVELAVAAEAAGWDGFFLWDHIVIGDGIAVCDPWVALAAVAQATDHTVIGPMVTPLPRRRPWVLARQAATLDHLSGGRLILGVGIGYPPDVEFGTFGEPEGDRDRAELLDEGLEVIHGMWSGEPFAYDGTHHHVRRTVFAPGPVGERIPIWVAGMWPNRRPFRRAAHYDGVCPIAADMHTLSPAEVAQVVDYVGAHRTATTPYDVIVGGPIPSAGEVAEYGAAGVTWYQVGPDPAGESVAAIREMVAEGPPR